MLILSLPNYKVLYLDKISSKVPPRTYIWHPPFYLAPQSQSTRHAALSVNHDSDYVHGTDHCLVYCRDKSGGGHWVYPHKCQNVHIYNLRWDICPMIYVGKYPIYICIKKNAHRFIGLYVLGLMSEQNLEYPINEHSQIAVTIRLPEDRYRAL